MPLTFFRIVLVVCVAFSASEIFAQCGADGTQPCPPPTKKPTETKKPTTKPAASKPTTSTKKPPANVSKPKPQPQPRFVPRAPEIEMVRIPAGSFMMGSNNGEAGEKPVHKVSISRDFWMGKYEVTQTQWRAVMGSNPSRFSNCGGDCPVENVSWEDAQTFIRKLNNLQSEYEYRLPTEGEWEYAARAGTTTAFAFGDSLSSSQANFDGNYPYGGAAKGRYLEKTVAVGSYQPNAWGLYDMHGNVWEWCQDWYGSYSSGTATDPVGASSGSGRVYRGGSWNYYAVYLRSAYRGYDSPFYLNSYLGFRLVRQ